MHPVIMETIKKSYFQQPKATFTGYIHLGQNNFHASKAFFILEKLQKKILKKLLLMVATSYVSAARYLKERQDISERQ